MHTLLKSAFDWASRSRRKLATGSVGCLAIVMAWHVIFGANGLVVYQQKRHEYHQLQQQIQSLQQQTQDLGQQIKALRTDPQSIEKEAREHLRYARPGELVYTLPGKPAVAPVRK